MLLERENNDWRMFAEKDFERMEKANKEGRKRNTSRKPLFGYNNFVNSLSLSAHFTVTFSCSSFLLVASINRLLVV